MVSQLIMASAEGHQIGLNVLGFILDEANFRKGVGLGNAEEYSEVTRLYQQLIDRQITRFATPSGSKAFAILISSASYQSSFSEKRKQAALTDNNTKCIPQSRIRLSPRITLKRHSKCS